MPPKRTASSSTMVAPSSFSSLPSISEQHSESFEADKEDDDKRQRRGRGRQQQASSYLQQRARLDRAASKRFESSSSSSNSTVSSSSKSSLSCGDHRKGVRAAQRFPLLDREYETMLLLNAYDRTITRSNAASADGDRLGQYCDHSFKPRTTTSLLPELLLITGKQGMGKTALANYLQTKVEQDGGKLLIAKCPAPIAASSTSTSNTPFQASSSSRISPMLLQPQQEPYGVFQAIFNQLVQATPLLVPTGDSKQVSIQDKISAAISSEHQQVLLDFESCFSRLFSIEPVNSATTTATRTTTTTTMQDYKHDITVGDPIHEACIKFLNEYCRIIDRPIVLVLDDVHWMDCESLALLRSVVVGCCNATSSSKLMIVATCDSEMDGSNSVCSDRKTTRWSLSDIRSILKQEGDETIQITSMELSGLSHSSVMAIIQQSMIDHHGDYTKKDYHRFAAIMTQVTKGNPFWIHQILSSEGRIWDDKHQTTAAPSSSNSDPVEPTLSTQSECLSNAAHSLDNAITLTESSRNDIIQQNMEQVAQSSILARQLLQVTAFLGSTFQMSSLQTVLEDIQSSRKRQVAEVNRVISELQTLGILQISICSDGNDQETRYDVVNGQVQPEGNGSPNTSRIKWTSDQFQQEAYRLVPDERAARLHMTIGKALFNTLKSSPASSNQMPSNTDNSLHLVVWQYLLGHNVIDGTKDDRETCAHLALLAGEKALSTNAYSSAHDYFELTRQLLFYRSSAGSFQRKDEEHLLWTHQPSLLSRLFAQFAAVKCAVGDYTGAEELVHETAAFGLTLMDRLPILEVHMHQLVAQGRYDDAIATGLDVLQDMGHGVDTPSKINRRRIVQMWHKRKEQIKHLWPKAGKRRSSLSRKTLEIDARLPTGNDARSSLVLRIVRVMVLPLLHHQHWYFKYVPILANKCLDVLLSHGASSEASIGYLLWGITLCQPSIGLYQDGVTCGQMAIDTADGCSETSSSLRSFLTTLNLSYCQPYTFTLKKSVAGLKDIHQRPSTLVKVATTSLHDLALAMLSTGTSLPEVLEKVQDGRKTLLRHTNSVVSPTATKVQNNSVQDTLNADLHQALTYLDIASQAICALLKRSDSGSFVVDDTTCLLVGSYVDECEVRKAFCDKDCKQGLQLLLFWKAYVAFHLGHYHRALDFLSQMRALSKATAIVDGADTSHISAGCTSYAMQLEVVFMDTLSTIIVNRGRHSKRLRQSMELLEQLHRACPDNVANRVTLCRAELASQRNRSSKSALKNYLKSIAHSIEHGHQVEYAMALTRLALFQYHCRNYERLARRNIHLFSSRCLVNNDDDDDDDGDDDQQDNIPSAQLASHNATDRFIEARRVYQKWGCTAKASRLTRWILRLDQNKDKCSGRNGTNNVIKANNKAPLYQRSSARTCRTDVASSYYEEFSDAIPS